MLTITAKNEAGAWVQLDVFENEPVSLTYAFQDIQNVNTAKGSHTQEFRLPATDTNKHYFGAVEDHNKVGGFTIKLKHEAVVSNDGLPILTGHLQFKGAIVKAGDVAEYDVVIFGEFVDMAAGLQGVRLRDLDFSAYNHTLNYTNVVASFGGSLHGGVVRYGVIDRAFGWLNTDINLSDTANTLHPYQLTPFVRVKTVLDAIFARAGYTYTSAFFTAHEMYMPAFAGGDVMVVSNANTPQLVVAGLASNATPSGSALYVFTNLTDSGSYFYDSNASFSSSTWTAAVTATVTAEIHVKATLTAGSTMAFRMGLAKGPTYSSMAVQSGIYTINGSGNGIDTTVYLSLPVIAGETYRLAAFTESGWSSGTLTFDGTSAPEYVRTFVRFGTFSGVLTGGTVRIAENMPDYAALDYLADLQAMFNLVFVPDRNTQTIRVEPAKDYFESGSVLDWSQKIDRTTDVQLTPTTDLQTKTYEWTFAESDDIVNTAFVDTALRVCGRQRITDTENDFAEGDTTITAGHAPFVINRVGSMLLFKGYDSDGAVLTEPLPMICYFAGNITGAWRMFSGTTSTLQSTYPLFSPFSAEPATLTSNSLFFGNDAAHIVTAYPVNTLYNRFWAGYVRDLYSEESRIMTADFFLTPGDIATFSFADTIYTHGGYWRILDISGYVANLPGVCSVTLLKIFDEPRACVYIPHTVSIDGIVTFTDASGATSGGSEECCTLYGYRWDGSRCYAGPVPNTYGPSGGVSPQPYVPPTPDLSDIEEAIDDIRLKTDYISITQAVNLDTVESNVATLNGSVSAISADLDLLYQTFNPKGPDYGTTKVVYQQNKTDGTSLSLTQTAMTLASVSGRTSLSLTETSPGVFRANVQDDATPTPNTVTAIYATASSNNAKVGNNPAAPTAALEVNGGVKVTGNLTVSGTVDGRDVSVDGAKLDTIATGAEVNQLAFTYVQVGASTIAANTKTGTLTLAAGSGVSLTANTTTDTITIDNTAAGADVDAAELFMVFFEK